MFSTCTKKCPGCSTSVYPNDPQVKVKSGDPWHKPCFRCAQCNCQLTLRNFAVAGDEMLCTTHYMYRFHTSNSYGGGEKFRNATISEKLRSGKTHAVNDCESADTAVRCPSPVSAIPPTDVSTESTGSVCPSESDSRPLTTADTCEKCETCQTVVSPTDDKMQIDEKLYHKECFKCNTCNSQLSLTNFTSHGTELLCETHNNTHAQNMSSIQLLSPQDSSALVESQKQDICTESTVEAEEEEEDTDGPDFHQIHEIRGVQELNLAEREEALENVADCEDREQEQEQDQDQDQRQEQESQIPTTTEETVLQENSVIPNAKSCSEQGLSVECESLPSPPASPASAAGPKEESVGGNEARTAVPAIPSPPRKKLVFSPSPKCQSCGDSVYHHDLKIAIDDNRWHQRCFKCSQCKCQLTLSNFTTGGDKVFCKTHYFELFHKNNGYEGGEKFQKRT